MRLNMSVIPRLSLLAIFALILVFADPILVAGQGWCGCDGGYNWLHGNPALGGSEQSIWESDTNCFLSDSDSCCSSVYTQPQNGTNTYNATTAGSSIAPAYTSSYNALYNKSIVNGNATYWLNLGNSLYKSGRYRDALDAYNALLNLEPQNADALAGRSLALQAIEGITDGAVT
jgi:tetratricopeptide (TPR) repeat protein